MTITSRSWRHIPETIFFLAEKVSMFFVKLILSLRRSIAFDIYTSCFDLFFFLFQFFGFVFCCQLHPPFVRHLLQLRQIWRTATENNFGKLVRVLGGSGILLPDLWRVLQNNAMNRLKTFKIVIFRTITLFKFGFK